MDSLLSQLDENLKELYRKALDADAVLEQLQQQGQAKHQSIFPAGSDFSVNSNRFMPYLSEAAEQVAAIRQSQQFNTATLARVVKQLQLLHKTLAEFRLAVSK
ncbi:prephenate dehydrogenase [Arsukibacterium sp.]|uniref:prephenate dehydrogenase n=1 Tax=Arsukibacterium sp. TaxID=1977258 RepID=UPI00356ABD2D